MLSISQELELSETIVSLHPHKSFLTTIEPKVYILRKGWPSFFKFSRKVRK